MLLEKIRNMLRFLWIAFAAGCALVQIVFEDAGMIEFTLAVIGFTLLVEGMALEVALYYERKKEEISE
ncbi:hypothetical protein NRIC_35580 [Enterococcus florum]|uniref:Uncharacterized protein n=1 Tax=Enterococcus florum TaxID=2480627 RepID=A0A4P5PBV0_9ENTE|nr:hypothetical protein [Enterococcus florum]GCF95667.1 hypothetical protein NRIC_35580 [Enterococcus florum]